MENRIKNSSLIIMVITIIVIITFCFIRIFTQKSEPFLLDYAKKKSITIISLIINNSINKNVYRNNYDSIIDIEKNNNGNITSLKINNSVANEVLYLVTDDILNNIKLLENGNYDLIEGNYLEQKDSIYYIPLGVMYNNPILVNIGPKIPFKIKLLGSINDEIETNVKEYGINSSLIEICIHLNMEMQVIFPFKSESINISKNIILDSRIVQGDIPKYYGGIITNTNK